jgi:TPR repeat protein
MRHTNHSVPSLPSRGPPEYDASPDHAGPLPSIHRDPSALVDSMNAMRINDPLPRGYSAMSSSYDPIPRAGTSMSMQTPQRGFPHPRHANTLPPANAAPPLPPYRQTDTHYPVDDSGTMYHQCHADELSPSRSNVGYPEGGNPLQPGADVDIVSMYSYDDAASPPTSAYPSSESSAPFSRNLSAQPYYPQNQFQPGWQGSQQNLAPHYGHSHPGPPQPGEYDHLYTAASNVLGMGPPPPQPPMNPYFPPNPYSQTPLQASQSMPYLPPTGVYHSGPPGPPGTPAPPAPPAPTAYGSAPTLPEGFDDLEFEMRPSATSLHRAGTTASVNLSTRKTKAVDLTAPPYTKEYIDQYRQRIKADPDPEAHFLYAKYLIEAARKVGADARDQRAVKRYRDLLIQESLKTIRRLASQNEPYDEAQFFLANCHGTGMLGLQVDHERAYHLYLQAAKQNNPSAAYRVAVCNEIGAGTRRDPARAAAFYRKAASLGDTAAMYKLGMILLLGSLGEQKNPREAINWLKRAAEQADEENPHALHELAMLHELPNSQFVVHDPAYAKQLYTQSAHLGYIQSQFKLGQCYEYGSLTCPVDPRRSIAWYTKAAEKGYSEAELALSGWYLTGSDGVLKQSDSEAYLWARKAANKGLSEAEYAVGYYAEVGIGIKQDMDFAKRWYMRAAGVSAFLSSVCFIWVTECATAQGNKRAMTRLTEMKRLGNKRTNVGRPTRQQAKDECVIV